MKTSEAISPERQYNTKLGLNLFVVYLLLYLGFVLGNAFFADLMEIKVMLGLNLAIVYGFALIKMAFILSLVYGLMCKSEPASGSAENASPAASTEVDVNVPSDESLDSKEGDQ